MPNGFPLLRLPQNEIYRVLKSMELHQLVLLSFSSTRSKSLVESLNLKSSNEGKVWVLNGIDIFIWMPNGIQLYWHLYRDEFRQRDPNSPPMKMTKSKNVIFSTRGTDYPYSVHHIFNGMPLEMKDWLNHIKEILHFPIFHELAFWNDEGFFDIESIKSAVGKVNEVAIASPCTKKQISEKTRAFLLSKSLTFGNKVWPEKKPPGGILMQNFEILKTGLDGKPGNIDLDDLLLFNSKENYVVRNKLTEKDMNRYLKLWMKNRGDCRMESMWGELKSQMDIDKTAVFKGIKYQQQEIRRERWHKTSSGGPYSIVIHGGYDIIRRDGMVATISFFSGKWLEMFVWHDHCFGEPGVLG